MRHTKDRIADTALRLFNEAGTDSVSTNHIAAAMDISPGNLYYHFANKDEILLVLLERLATGLEGTWMKANASSGPESLRSAVADCFALLERYRFFARELYALAHRSPVLRDRSRVLAERCARAIEQVIDGSTDSGFWGESPDRSRSRWLASAVWLGVLAYASSAGLHSDNGQPEAWSDGVDSVMALLEPHLSSEPHSGKTFSGRVVHA
jgi:AcrR family transcriptional regulator